MRGEGGRPAWLADVAFLAGAAVATLFFYRDFVFQPDGMLFGTDMLDQAFQLRKFATDEWRAGRGLPLWNPFVYGGLPFLAILPGPLFYPTTLLYLLLPLYRAIGWTFVIHTFLAGAFGYFAGRSFQLGRWASSVVGVSFMFAGYIVSTLYGGHDGRFFAMVLIPLAFGLLERAMRSDRVEWFMLLGLAIGLQIFTPHVQVMYFSSLAIAAYAAFVLWLRYREAGALRALASPTAKLGMAFTIAALVGLVQLWPTASLLEMAVRGVPGQEGYEFASSWSLPPQELSALLLPDLIGSLNEYWGTNPFKLHTEYIGALPLALLLIGFLGRKPEARQWFFAAAAALGLLFALGAATPVHRLAYHVVPLIERFRAPAMMLGPVTFAVALLAGYGWQAIADARAREGSLPWSRLMVGCVVFLLPILAAVLAPQGIIRWALNGWFPAGWPRQPSPDAAAAVRTGAALALVVWLAVLGTARAVETGRAGEWLCAGLLLLGALDLGRVGGRYLISAPVEQLLPADSGLEDLSGRMASGERAWPLPDTYRPNELMFYGIPAITGSQNFRLEWYERLVGGIDYANLGGRRVLWSLLDLKYLTMSEEVNLPFLAPVGEGAKGRIYRLAERTPHAFFPARLETVADTAAALSATLALENPFDRAIVETGEYPGAPAAAGSDPVPGSGEARIESYTPNEVTLSVSAARTGLLFVSEIYHPNWSAWIDGEPAPIYRTNTAFRGVVVPEGEHELAFRYRSTELVVGGTISGLTALFALLGASAVAFRRRRKIGEESGRP